MPEKPIITLLKSGNHLVLKPPHEDLNEDLIHNLRQTLSYDEVRMIPPNERNRGDGSSSVEVIPRDMYILDHKGRIATVWGLYHRIQRRLSKCGFDTTIKDLDPHPRPEVFVPRWERLYDPRRGITLKPGQERFLMKFMSHPCGRFDCPPGFGKSFMIGLIAILLPKARIDVVTRRVPVLRDRIYPEICQMTPSVGIVGGGKKIKDRRVMLYSAGSLHHAEGDADIVIADECHEIASDSVAEKMSVYQQSRCFGLSATHDMRLDNKDLRVEGMFGPVIYRMSYQQAQKHKLVVPIEVKWTDVIMNVNPAGEYDNSVEKKRHGIWKNHVRNRLIADDALQYDDDTQVLITCETISHMVYLNKLLPDFQLVYAENGMSALNRRDYIKRGLLPRDFPPMTTERRMSMTKDFESGKLKKVICNTVWNVGVNFTQLNVLIRADGGGSPINDVQIPGRASRTHDGKTSSIIHDYTDKFDSGFRRKALNRERMYKKQGWTQVKPDPTKGRNPQQVLFNDNFKERH